MAEAVLRFMSEHGALIPENTIVVIGYLAHDLANFEMEDGEYAVYIDARLHTYDGRTWAVQSWLQSLVHELVHVDQAARGRFVINNNAKAPYFEATFDGRHYSYDERDLKAYESMPWEREAWEFSSKFADELIMHMPCKEHDRWEISSSVVEEVITALERLDLRLTA